MAGLSAAGVMNMEAMALWHPGTVGKPEGFNFTERVGDWEEWGGE